MDECVQWQRQDARARADEREKVRIAAEQAVQAQMKADQVAYPNNRHNLTSHTTF
jgi:hypothetical protein